MRFRMPEAHSQSLLLGGDKADWTLVIWFREPEPNHQSP
jgi:hypothetical protein